MRTIAPFLLLLATLPACAFSDGLGGDTSSDDDGAGGKGSPASTGSAPPGACEGPLGAPRDPSTLPECAAGAHCVETIPESYKVITDACADGGFCVPDEFISTGGVFMPKACTALGGAGACMSLAFSQVAENQQFLPQDVCDDDERCVPCISPLDQSETGACELGYECPGSSGGSGGGAPTGNSDDPATCEYDGTPVLDPTMFPACPANVCGSGGHCVPSSQVPPDLAGNLAACDASSYCVPDPFLEAGSDKIKVTSCQSIGGYEGRCMSMCLPQIAEQKDSLPHGAAAGCPETDACIPCTDPLTGEPTGACTSLACDAGPANPPQAFPKCCGGIGTCIPFDQIPPEEFGHLPNDICGAAGLCTPNGLIPGYPDNNPFDITNDPCETDFLLWSVLGDKYRAGVCMPNCLPEVGNSPLGQGSCNHEWWKCSPCYNPLDGTWTGACGATPP